MIKSLLDCTILKVFHDGEKSLVYQAIRSTDQQPVVLKTLKANHPTTSELARYQHEFDILSTLNLPCVIQAYELKPFQNNLVLILEDFGGESLAIISKEQPLSFNELLSIFVQVADCLGHIHAANIIHKDINPKNIVYNVYTKQVKLIDFGLSSRLPRENLLLQNPHQLEGTLAYISPEQTGRMNRALDYRTDLYSLGVTFYELLTKQLPFNSLDLLEMIHSHIAKRSVPPHEINPQIPLSLSELILKLMAKNAEDRYQSAFGLKHDLEYIFNNLDDLKAFELAQQDISSKFHLPQKLYGRDNEIQVLWEAFDYISKGSAELLLIAGYSGIGKTALVQELYKPMTAKHGYFIAGKFDQFQRNIPYSAVIQAFRDLVRQLLTETQTQLEYWKTQLINALGNRGQIIIDVIAEVELIIGEQPPVPELAPAESQNRFNLVFQSFVKVFCQANHPLVIFLDDLQWSDAASLKLITLMMNDIPHLLLIGAYRDNEVNALHPLTLTIEEMQEQYVSIKMLNLNPLNLNELNQLVSDALHLAFEQTLPLAELVLEKTGGNPFFVGEFLKTLYTEYLLEFNNQQRQWEWDLTRIQQHNITDNVVELMMAKIQRLSVATQTLLKLAASIGNQFNLESLSIIHETLFEQIKNDVWEALEEGLIIPFDTDYKFVHDRVQQAAYSLIPETEKPAVHWRIGQVFLNKSNLQEKLFEIVDHLNQGSVFAATSEEKLQLVQLNLQAAQKAKSALAYRAALDYIQKAFEFLPADSWQTHYQLSLSMYEAASEIAYLCGEWALLETWSASVLTHAKTALEKVRTYEIKISAMVMQTNHLEALNLAQQWLALFEINFPATPTWADVEKTLLETKQLWEHQAIGEFFDLPLVTDEQHLAIMKILDAVVASAYLGNPLFFLLIISKMVGISIQHGHTKQAPSAYGGYGVVLCGLFSEIEQGYQFGKLSLRLLDKLKIDANRSRVLHVFNSFISHWKEPLRKAFPSMKQARQLALENGDLEYVGYTSQIYCRYSLLAAQPLVGLVPEMSTHLEVLTDLKQNITVNYLTIDRQIALTLSQTSLEYYDSIDKNIAIPLQANLTQINDQYGLFQLYFSRLLLSYLFDNPVQAVSAAELAERHIMGALGEALSAVFYFYDSLARLQIYSTLSQTEQEKLLEKVASNQSKMQLWATHAPANYQHKHDLVEAEKARVLDDFEKASQHYEQAISGAKIHDYIQEEALAYELAGQFYFARNMKNFAQMFLQEALYLYQRWGAHAKAQHLQNKYAQFFLVVKSSEADHQQTNYNNTFIAPLSSTTTVHKLNLDSIFKASQILAGEIVLKQLLEKMMYIVIENAGADKGFLLLPKQNQWVIEAEGSVGQQTTSILQSLIPTNALISLAIANYVIRTQQTVVLNNAKEEGGFVQDEHITQSQAQSVLCLPLKNQGELRGILYLENSLTTGAFSATQLEVLNLLSSQLAISIENALLYANLEQKVEERTQELAEKNERLVQLNQEKNEFLGIAAHDLKNPLSGILGLSQLIEESADELSTEELLDMAKDISTAAKQMFDLIVNLLDVNQIESGKFNVNLQAIDLAFVLQRIVNNYQDRAAAKQIQLRYQTPDFNTITQLDISLIRQVLDNLLSNAIKYSPLGRNVYLRFIETEQTIRCEIRDEGSGLSEKDQQKLFGKFTRLSTKPTAGEHSTGLGLFIVKKLVTAMNGNVWCESVLGEGATFIVEFAKI
jgi:predicted ATPase/signal transduction histidine kinase